ncbi:MAG: hypothetical protein ABIK81_00120 [candidate division WOR-3 bacterium]
MRPKSLITFILGGAVFIFGVYGLVCSDFIGIVPLAIGISLVYLGWRGGRQALAIFGHTVIVVGCFLVTLGIYLLPYSKPTLFHIFTRPLFWGLFSILGGVCANYHSFCQCMRR